MLACAGTESLFGLKEKIQIIKLLLFWNNKPLEDFFSTQVLLENLEILWPGEMSPSYFIEFRGDVKKKKKKGFLGENSISVRVLLK